MPLYFAYGSNMDRAAMARRCPASRVIGPGRLMRHRFFVSRDGYASVMRDPHGTVWGLLWELALADVSALDRYESLATGLYTKVIQPILVGQGPRRAMVYIGRTQAPGSPRPGYMEGVVRSAEEAGLPLDHIRDLRRWLPNSSQASESAEIPKVRPRWDAPSGSLGKFREI